MKSMIAWKVKSELRKCLWKMTGRDKKPVWTVSTET